MWRRYISFGLVILLVGLPLGAVRAQDPATPQAPTPDDTSVVRVWWPDDLYGTDVNQLEIQLARFAEGFSQANPRYQVAFRLKRANGPASILSTLNAAQPVAPSAMPDLVLLKRADLVTAMRSGLIMSLEAWFPDSIRADLFPNVIALGQVDDMLYGIPYALNLQHVAYRTANFEAVPTTFEAVLTSQQRFVLPGSPPGTVEINEVLLGQYLAAGGRLVDSAGLPTLDQEPLLEVLSYYAEGQAEGIFTENVLDYSQTADYWSRFADGDLPIAVVQSSTYLRDATMQGNVAFASLPTVNGEPLILMNGWLWALVTEDPNQQMVALAFLEYLMDAETQADQTRALSAIPTRQRALRLWPDADYNALVNDWISQALIIPVDQHNNVAARQLQAAFEAVLTGTPVDEAVEAALAFLSSG